jgi:hypothetical protein
MKKIKNFIIVGILIGFISCTKDQADMKSNSIITENGQISKSLAEDPLFKKLDKAFYEMNMYSFTHRAIKIDRTKLAKINADVKSKKIATVEEFKKAFNDIASPEYLKYCENVNKVLHVKKALFNKYPELKKIPTSTFSKFLIANKTQKFSIEEIKNINRNKNPSYE